LAEFLDHLNGLHENIKFTMETEKDGHLPFLDIDIYREPDGSLGYRVYRKPTHTNLYLHANSHHHPSNKQAVLGLWAELHPLDIILPHSHALSFFYLNQPPIAIGRFLAYRLSPRLATQALDSYITSILSCYAHSSLMMEAVRTSETSVDNHFTRQYIPEDNSEHQTAIISLNSVNHLIDVMVKCDALYEVRTELLNIIWTIVGFKGLSNTFVVLLRKSLYPKSADVR
jgi:hypothetical protein